MYYEYLNENSDIAVTYQQIKERLENRKKCNIYLIKEVY